ncbi:hypothetical protein ACFLZV_06190 [Candidatus Margulisiibacteriota bacterium]
MKKNKEKYSNINKDNVEIITGLIEKQKGCAVWVCPAGTRFRNTEHTFHSGCVRKMGKLGEAIVKHCQNIKDLNKLRKPENQIKYLLGTIVNSTTSSVNKPKIAP